MDEKHRVNPLAINAIKMNDQIPTEYSINKIKHIESTQSINGQKVLVVKVEPFRHLLYII